MKKTLTPVLQAEPEDSGPQGLKGRTVLVVDDEADTRDMLRTVLQGASAHVFTASGGQDAMQQLRGGEDRRGGLRASRCPARMGMS